MNRSRLQSKVFTLTFGLLIILSSFSAVISPLETVGIESREEEEPTRGGEQTRGEGTTRGKEDTWYVDDDAAAGGDGSVETPYQKIQDAIDASSDGDTVRVFNGTYGETVVMNKNGLSLIGNGSSMNTINGGGSGNVVRISKDGCTIRGFTILESGIGMEDAGIKVESDNNMISENHCTSCRSGIYVISDRMNNTILNSSCSNGSGLSGWAIRLRPGCQNNIIRGNTCSNYISGISITNDCSYNILDGNSLYENGSVISLSFARNNVLSNNTCSRIQLFKSHYCTLVNNSCTVNSGSISLGDTFGCTLKNNQITGGILNIDGGSLEHWNTHDIDNTNTVDGVPVRYYKNETDMTIPPGVGQLILANCSHVLVENQSKDQTVQNIQVGVSSYLTIANNTFSNSNSHGISVSNSDHCTIVNNSCINNSDGIYLAQLTESIVEKNNCSNNDNGISLNYCSDTILLKNYCSGNDLGIVLSYSNTCLLENNTCSNNDVEGISLFLSDHNSISNGTYTNNSKGVEVVTSHYNTFSGNTVSHNEDGFSFEIDPAPSLNNIVLMNNILFNSENAIDASKNGDESVDAANNWWGDPTGPYHSSDNPDGVGDRVTDNVEFDPWLSRPSGQTLTIYVDDDALDGGNGSLEKPYNKIQDAVNASENGDTLRVFDGTYNENVLVNKRIDLSGNGSKTTSIDGRGSGDVVTITGDWVSMSGFLVTGSGDWENAGIKLDSDYNKISNNNCSKNAIGIYLKTSYKNTLSDNTMIENGIFISGSLNSWNSHTIGTTNTANGKPLYYYKNVTGFTVPEGAGQVILANCSRIKVENQNCSNTTTGILIGYSSLITITNNTCSSNIYGMDLYSSSECTITNNTFSNNYRGIRVQESSDCKIISNICSYNEMFAIYVMDYSDGCIVMNNTFSENLYGIRLRDSSDCIIRDNTISGNYDGIYLRLYSGGNVAHYNNIHNNSNWGIRTDVTSTIDASNNWWGDASGPYHPTENPEGKGDNVTDYVEIDPWFSEQLLWQTLYVANHGNDTLGDGTEEKPFLTIQNAVDESRDGDTIRVFQGVYEENVVVDKSVDIMGNGSGETVIQGVDGGVGDCIEVGHADTSERTRGVEVRGDYAYVANGNDGMVIMDISDKENPTAVGFYDAGGFVWNTALVGDLAYVAAGFNGLMIVNISDVENPVQVGHYDTAEMSVDVAVNEGLAFVADYSGGLVIVNVSDPKNPHEEGQLDIFYAKGIAVRGNYAYVGSTIEGLVIVNVTDEKNPTEEGTCTTDGGVQDLDVRDNYAYMADYDNGMVIIDISDTTDPQEVSQFNTTGEARGIKVENNFAYVALGEEGLIIVDVAEKGIPIEAAHLDTVGDAHGVTVMEEFAFIASENDGLYVVEMIKEGTSMHLISPCNLRKLAITNGSVAGVVIDTNLARLTECKMYGNAYGIRVINGSSDVVVSNCDIFENRISGIHASDNSGKMIDAHENWWGHPSGPYHPSQNPDRKGDAVTDFVDFEPWLTRPKDFKQHHVSPDGNDSTGSGDMGNPYKSIQKALEMAQEWDTIQVVAGIYSGPITINKQNVTIIGDSSDTTFLDAGGAATTCTITADNVELNGFTIGNGLENGILFINSHGNEIINCVFPDNSFDINLSNSKNIQLINTTFQTVNINDSNSSISVLWPIDLNVVDNRSGFIPDAHLKLTDTDGTAVFDGYTDNVGMIPQILVLEYERDLSGQRDYNPYTISIWNDGYLNFEEELTFSSYTSLDCQLQAHNLPVAIISGEIIQEIEMDSYIFFDGSDSTGRSITYRWQFGDGGLSSSPTPSHTYTTPGAYQVNLTVTDDYENTTMASIIVVVENVVPTARAETSTYSAIEDEEIQFDAGNSWDTSSDSISFFWDFGDGTQSSKVSPTHIYQDAGEYDVSLIAMDMFGGESTTNLHITITNLEPVIIDTNFTGLQYPGKPLYFSVLADDTPEDLPSLQYSWDFGDGTIGYEQNVTHTFREAGMYNVTVTVTDNNGASDSSEIQIIIADPEITTSVSSTSILQDETVFYNASHELDDGSFIYTWYFGDGATDDWNYSSHTYVQSGIFSPWLIINTGIENVTIFLQEIQVSNVIPIPQITVDKLLVDEDESIFFDASYSWDSPSDSQRLTYTWDFNDGTTDFGIDVTHVFSDMGIYTVVLTVGDGKVTRTTEVEIGVPNLVPVANAGTLKVRKAAVGETVIFDASGTTDTPSDLPDLNYTWKIGDDRIYGGIVSYTFETPGTFSVILEVRDNNGAESQDALTFDVSKSSTSADEETMGTISWILLLIIIVFLVVIGFLFTKLRDEQLYKEMKAEQAEEKKFVVEEEAIVVEGTMDDNDFKRQEDDIQVSTVEVDVVEDEEISKAVVGPGGGGGTDDDIFKPPSDDHKS